MGKIPFFKRPIPSIKFNNKLVETLGNIHATTVFSQSSESPHRPLPPNKKKERKEKTTTTITIKLNKTKAMTKKKTKQQYNFKTT